MAGIITLAAASVVWSSAAPGQRPVAVEGGIPLQRRFVRVRFRTPEAASAVRIGIAPLYDGYAVAVSCRWDDNNSLNLRARQIMEAHGIRGTWYLNGNRAAFHTESDYRPTARDLLRGGNSLGGHSLTHPYFSGISRNRMFREVAQARIEWEAELDTLVTSYAFSYVDYGQTPDARAVQADAIRCLLRAGYLHVAEFKGFDTSVPSDLAFSPIMPPEGADLATFGRAVDWALGDRDVRDRCPMVSNSMHAWYGSEALPQFGWDELARRLALLRDIPDAWHCNQNAYAAYMWLRKWSRLEAPRVVGSTVTIALHQPTAVVTNSAVAPTLELTGIRPADIAAAACDGVPATVSDRSHADRVLLNVAPPAGDEPPSLVGTIECDDRAVGIESGGEDPDFPGLRAAMRYDGRKLRLWLRNGSKHALEQARLTWRLPPAFSDGVVRETMGTIRRGAAIARGRSASAAPADPKLRVGEAYLVGQLDFRWNGRSARLYVTCTRDLGNDPSFPHGAFRVIGPLRTEQISPDRLDRVFAGAELVPETVSLDGPSYHWRHNRSEGHVPDAHLDPEIIRTSGGWRDLVSEPFLLAARVVSMVEQTARITGHGEDLKRIYLNGRAVKPTDEMRLRAGPNTLVIAYHFDRVAGSYRHVGCFFRLTDASGSRLTNICYEPIP